MLISARNVISCSMHGRAQFAALLVIVIVFFGIIFDDFDIVDAYWFVCNSFFIMTLFDRSFLLIDHVLDDGLRLLYTNIFVIISQHMTLK